MRKQKRFKSTCYAGIHTKELIENYKVNTTMPFQDIIDIYSSRIYNTAFGITKNHSEAEEVLQETFIVIYKNIDQLRSIKALSSWIHRITVNSANMKMRKQKRDRHLQQKVSFENIDMTINSIDNKEDVNLSSLLGEEEKNVVMQAISDLPDGYKNVILLNDFKNFSLRKTSDILNISIPAVKSRLHRARRKLKRKLDTYFKESSN